MTLVLDSAIFGDLFTDADVSQLFSDEAYVRAFLAVEGALARTQGKLGIIPEAAATEISDAADPSNIEISALNAGTLRSGFPIIALTEQLRKKVNAENAGYVHFGATTQDIMDTAAVLQLHAATALLNDRLAEIVRELDALAERHRTTVMAARTHGQQALPTTFGLKVTGWLAPFLRHRERLDELAPRLLVIQFGGAAGTLAALENRGLEVMEALADELHLSVPLMPWHAQRDNLVEFAGWLSLVTGSAAKMAQDIILLAQTEVGEATESNEGERGGSSTMPQKTNPITSELIVAAARTNASLLSAMHHAQIQEHERATHGWQMEWLALPQMILLTGGALKHALYLAQNMQPNPEQMRENIARAHDLVLAEAATFALAKTMPRSDAEALVKQACALAVAEGKPLIEVVRRLTDDPAAYAGVPWQSLSDPARYLGETQLLIDRVLQRAKDLS
ncbi:MAG TPA: 3-carboxy-cis,cis-muconate cycloisomerase [Candidatus Binatia bacterium]|jgi:3-carboxy-cis,cis-muconate cycloisomerase